MRGPSQTSPIKVSLTIGASTEIPFPPTLTDDSGFTSFTEEENKNMETLVSPGDIMIWKMSGDVIEINNIAKYRGNDVFIEKPSKQTDGTWRAVIGKFPSGNYWQYNIIYSVKGATKNPYTQDPKIRIKP